MSSRIRHLYARVGHTAVGATLAFVLTGVASAQTSSGWKGTTSTDFQTAANWSSGFGNSFNLSVGQAWQDAGRSGSTTLNNAANYNGYRLTFDNIAGGPNPTFTVQGSNLNLFNFGGSAPQISNNSLVSQQVNTNVVFKTSTGSAAINATGGSITFGATAGASAGKIFLNDASGTYQFNLTGGSGNTITFNGAVNNKDGTAALRTAITGNEDVVFAGGLSGTGDLLKQGTGTATFISNPSTFGGTNAVFIDQGTVAIGTGGSVGTTNGTTTGLINMGSDNVAGLNTTVNIANGSVTVANPFTVRFVQTGGKAIGGSFTSGNSLYSGSVSLADHVSLNQASSGILAFSGVISQAAGTLSATPGVGNVNNSVPQAGNSFNAGNTKGPGILINGSGTSGTIEFDAANTYTGDTVVQAGTLQFALAGSSTSTIRLGNSSGIAPAALNIADGHVVNGTINVRPGSAGLKSIGGTNPSGTTATYSGHVALDDNATFVSTNAGAVLAFTQAHGADTTTGFDIKNKIATFSGAGDFNLTGEVYESAAAGNVAKKGAGTLFLSFNTNTYTGGTNITEGVLKVNTTGGLGATSSAVTINGGTLEIAQAGSTTSNKSYLLGNSGGTIQTDSGVSLKLGGVLGNAASQTGALTKTGAGTLSLGIAATYSGTTSINAGTFALATGGSIDNTPSISIAAGATFDVSALPAYTLSGTNSITASGSGTAATAATIVGGTSVSLGSRPLALTFTPVSFSGDATHPSLVVSQGTLVLNNNSVTVQNAAGSALGPGTYRLVAVSSGTITGAPNATVTVTGAGVAAGDTASLSVSGGSLNLEVRATPAFSNLSASQSVSYGTNQVTLAGKLSAPGSLYPANGETISVTINGNTQTTTVSGGTGDFSINYNPSTLPASATPYAIAYGYAGSGTLNPANDTSRSLTVNKAAQTITFGVIPAKTYGDAAFDPGAAASSGMSVSYSSSDTNVATVSGHSVTIVGAGSSTITASQPGDANHDAAPAVQQTLTVSPKALTVTGLAGEDKVYDANTSATFSGAPVLNGIVNADDVSLTGNAIAAFADKDVGTGKTITVSGYTLGGTAAAKYALTQPSLSGNITAKPLSVSGLTGENKVYDGNASATFAGTPQLSGVIAGEENLVALGGSPSATFADKNVGTGKSITVSGFTISGSGAANYTLSQPSLTGDITTKSLTVTADNQVKSKGSSDPTFTYASEGLVGDDSISGSLARSGGEGAGSYPITQGSLDGGANYAVTFTAGTLVITGPVAVPDTVTRLTNSTALDIPLTSLIGNDSRIAPNGSSQTDNLSVTAVADGTGNHVALSGNKVVYQPTDSSATAPLTFTYTLSDGTSVDTGTVTVNTSGTAPLILRVTGKTGPTYNAGTDTTTITISFVGVPNQAYAMEYSTNLTSWPSYGSVDTGATGAFSITITASGDNTAAWRSMFFRARE